MSHFSLPARLIRNMTRVAIAECNRRQKQVKCCYGNKFNPFDTMSRENLLAFIRYQTEQNAAFRARVEKLEAQLAKIAVTAANRPAATVCAYCNACDSQ